MSLNPTYPAAAVPYLMIRGAGDALEFYKKAFGAEETMRFWDARRQDWTCRGPHRRRTGFSGG